MGLIYASFGDWKINIGCNKMLLEDIYTLRTQVFVREEGFDHSMVKTEMDEDSVHIVIFQQRTPVACVSIVKPDVLNASWEQLHLPSAEKGSAVLVTKMIVLPTHRHHGLPVILVAAMDQIVFPRFGYRCAYVILIDKHCFNAPLYNKIAGCNVISHYKVTSSSPERIVMMMDRESLQFQNVRNEFLNAIKLTLD
ncbi:MAG: hypothetical protein HKN68_22120 [Saprospiraceae bacterium]|nr:hypothetical protein [Saprospiraceae bacterium]